MNIKQISKLGIDAAVEHLIETKIKYDSAESIFISKIKDNKNIIATWVYGSFSRGDFDSRSDIDFFVLTEKSGILQKIMKDLEIEILSKIGKNVHIEIQGLKIKEEDKSLIKTVLKEGRLLFSRGHWIWESSEFGLEPYYIYKYDITSIPSSQRNKLTRSLYSSKSWYYKNGKKISKEYPGMKDLIKLGKGCVMVPHKMEKKLLDVFRQLDLKYNLIRAVWV